MSNANNLEFLVGTSDDGKTVYANFQKTGHFISSGHVGSGRASFDEGAFVTYLLQNYSPDELQFVMIDPKMCQLTPYKDIPYLWRPLVLAPDDARIAVSDLLEEVDRRFDLLAEMGVTTITEYNSQSDTKLPFIILLCTEIADLMMIDREFYQHAFSMFALKSRAVGIHLYIATQRPSDDVLPDTLLGLISGRLVFAVASELDSIRLLGKSGAETINEKGRLIFKDYATNTDESVKAPYVSDDEVVRIIESINKKYSA